MTPFTACDNSPGLSLDVRSEKKRSVIINADFNATRVHVRIECTDDLRLWREAVLNVKIRKWYFFFFNHMEEAKIVQLFNGK